MQAVRHAVAGGGYLMAKKRRKRRRGGGSAKGSAFEREIAVALSEWWAGRDDVFWRTSGSGARATTRSKRFKKTAGQYGDICAIDPIGQPLLKMYTIELKRGYSRFTAFDAIDRPAGGKESIHSEWITKLKASAKQAGSKYWMLIVCRNRRMPIVFVPEGSVDISVNGDEEPAPYRFAVFRTKRIGTVVAMPLHSFLKAFSPERIKKCVKRG